MAWAVLQKEARTLIVLRLLGCVSCFLAVVLMVANRDSYTIPIFNVTVKATFHYTPAFRFLVAGNAVVSAYSFLAIFVPPTTPISAVILPLDLCSCLLLTGGLGAAGATAYVGKEGIPQAGWFPVCDRIPKFCQQSSAALSANLAGVFIYVLIVLHGIYYSSHPSIPSEK